jgi:hypothetical protein
VAHYSAQNPLPAPQHSPFNYDSMLNFVVRVTAAATTTGAAYAIGADFGYPPG